MLLDGDRHRAHPVDRVRAARRPRCGCCPALCLVGGGGRLDPARDALASAGCARSPSRRERHVGRAQPGSCSRGRALPRGGRRRDAAHRRCSARSAFEDPTPHYDLGGLWLERTGLPMVFAVWAAPEPLADGLLDLEHALVASVRLARSEPELLAHRRARRTATRPASSPATSRSSATASARASAPVCTRSSRWRATSASSTTSRAAVRARGGRRAMTSERPRRQRARGLDKALDGERISRRGRHRAAPSRDLVAVGRVRTRSAAAHRPVEGDVHRRPEPQLHERLRHRLRLLRVLSPAWRRARGLPPAEAVIYKKIEETLALGGTGLLMQGGHHPDLGIDYYEDLFRSIKARYTIHLHALSPPEIQHIARRSKLTDPGDADAATRRGPRLDPGGGAENLVDRVRDDHRAEEDEVRASGSTSCARRTGSGCRRRRR